MPGRDQVGQVQGDLAGSAARFVQVSDDRRGDVGAEQPAAQMHAQQPVQAQGTDLLHAGLGPGTGVLGDQDGAQTAGKDDALGLTEVLVGVTGAGGDPVTQVPDRVDLLG